jgi:hypothetical protein
VEQLRPGGVTPAVVGSDAAADGDAVGQRLAGRSGDVRESNEDLALGD